MKALCHLVLCLAVSSALAGCFDQHQRDAADASSVRDASAAIDDARRPPEAADARPPSMPDATALACDLVRADATCLESFAIVAGAPFSFPYQFDGCGCCVATECAVEVDERARVLRLATTLCPDPCDCAACIVPRGTCEVPALRNLGQWTVETNGTVAFAIGVVDAADPTFVPPPPGCATYAEIDECGGGVPDLTTGPVRGSVCVARSRDGAGRSVLRVIDECGSCGQVDSACTVVATPRRTRELPPRAILDVQARTYWTRCDVDCPDVCVRRERDCELPPLRDGDYYEVRVDGEQVLAFVAGEPFPACPD